MFNNITLILDSNVDKFSLPDFKSGNNGIISNLIASLAIYIALLLLGVPPTATTFMKNKL